MANPQLENGYTKIANELLEAICRIRLSDYEHRVVLMVIRKTYGYNKKEDWISLKQLSEETEIKLPHISRTIKKLLNRNIIAKQKRKVSIQKDYEKWLPKEVSNKVTQRGNVTQTGNKEKLPKEVSEVTQRGNKKLPKQVDTKERKKLIQKKGVAPYQKIIDTYNQNRNKMPAVKILSDNRKNTIRLRYKKYGLDQLTTLFEKAGKSDFLNGDNDRKWVANIDWLLKEANMVKVLEGNYDNKVKENKINYL
jgi:phage replication O-like protein O